MSIFFGPLTAVQGQGEMLGELPFDVFGSASAQNGVMSRQLTFAFSGATARSVSAPEAVVTMDAGVDFPVDATGGYFRTQMADVDINFGPSVLAVSSGGYMVGDLRFIGEAVGPEPVLDFYGDAALRTVAYGIIGIAAETADEVFSLGQSQTVDLGIIVDQPLSLLAPSVGALDSARAVEDEVRFGVAIELTYRILVAEGLLFADTPAEQYAAVANTIEALRLSGAVDTDAQALSLVAAAIVFGVQTDPVAMEKLLDGLVFGDSFDAAIVAAAELLDSILMGSTPTNSAVLALRVDDTLLVGTPVLSAAQLVSVIQSALTFGLRLSLGTGEYVAWALNTGSKHLSKFTQFPVNSFAVINGQLYGALDDGIYLLEGADDDGDNINARVRFALTDMGTGLQKRVATAYLGYTSTNDLLVKVVHTTEGGGKAAYVYRLNAAPATQPVNGRTTFGKGVKSAYFAFELENVDGGMFNVDKLSVIPMSLERRVKRS